MGRLDHWECPASHPLRNAGIWAGGDGSPRSPHSDGRRSPVWRPSHERALGNTEFPVAKGWLRPFLPGPRSARPAPGRRCRACDRCCWCGCAAFWGWSRGCARSPRCRRWLRAPAAPPARGRWGGASTLLELEASSPAIRPWGMATRFRFPWGSTLAASQKSDGVASLAR